MFADRMAVLDAFESWLRLAPGGATLVANVADDGVAAVVERAVFPRTQNGGSFNYPFVF